MDYKQQLIWIIAVIGFVAIIGVFARMKSGFGPTNLRVVGIVLIAVLAALLGLAENSVTSAMGILGAIAGYIFGIKDSGAPPA